MIILQLTTDYVIMICLCGQRHTFNFDKGGLNSKCGPFAFNDNDTIVYRFNDDGYNLGKGVEETFTISSNDFANLTNVSTDEIVAKLNLVLVNGKATNDFGTVLVESKITGTTSCVEVLTGTGAAAMGYNARGGEYDHHCCGRMVLGYVPPFLPRKEYTDMIALRRCNSCKGQPTLIRNMIDYSKMPGAMDSIPRKAANTLAVYLKSKGWVDPDLVSYYQEEATNPPEYFSQFPLQVNNITFSTYEEILALLGRKV